MTKLARFCHALTRRKPMDVNDDMPTDLDRCLNTLDLTALGVGATLGFGLYVLTGEVAAEKAGPGVILSFMIAAIASTFSALCYAEFAAKVPKSGSAYAYSYITVGEFIAFIIGWNLMLEHVIGTAALARGYSGYLSTLFATTTTTTTTTATTTAATSQLSEVSTQATNSSSDLPTALPLLMSAIGHASQSSSNASSLNHLASNDSLFAQFDSIALVLTILVTGLLLLGVQVSSRFQITFATINLSVAIFIFVCGLFKADFHNWNLSGSELPADGRAGSGGFLPFGIGGVVAGAGTVFFAFVGFDGIAATAEEVKNPRKAIPNSIIWTSIIIFFTYCGIATVQTLIWPYWDQKQSAPLPYIFEQLGMPFAKWTILVGVLAGLSTSFVGGFLPLPRIMYAMARDGVIYRVLSKISQRFKVPFVSTIVGGIIIALMASTLEISQLSDMLSIGTLAAYSLVSISVLLLRFEYRRPKQHIKLPLSANDLISNKATNVNINAAAAADGKQASNLQLALNSHLLLSPEETKASANQQQQHKVALPPKATSGKNSKLTNASLASTSSQVSSTSIATTISSIDLPVTNANIDTDNDSLTTIKALQQASGGKFTPLSLPRRDSAVAHIKRPLFQVFWQGKTMQNVQRTIDGDVLATTTTSLRLPDYQSTNISRFLISLLIIVTTIFDFALVVWAPILNQLDVFVTSTLSFLFFILLLLSYLLNRLPTTAPSKDSFEVPLVPGIPLFSIIINTYLMLNLPVMTWLRFAVWMAIGFFIYFTYGIFHSTGYKDSRCD